MFRWPTYVPVSERCRKAQKALEKMKKNVNLSPVLLSSSRIASTAWGQAWCRHLESFSDYSNRLPRGRSYVRNGLVVDLVISEGMIKALVQGSSLYKVNIKIKPIKQDQWSAIVKDCSGRIESLVELLRGKLSTAVMGRMCNHKTGLFPAVGEISLNCSCPDWADMCKHNAAVLFAVGNRLDTQPDLLFKLRRVDPVQLVSGVALIPGDSVKHKRVINDAALSDIFGIDVDVKEKSDHATAVVQEFSLKSQSPKSKSKQKVSAKSAKVMRGVTEDIPIRPEKMWVEQCAAAVAIKKKFGVRQAVEYLVEDKYVTFIKTAEVRPEFAFERRKFTSRIKKIFYGLEINDILRFLNKKHRSYVRQAFLESKFF
ncbi:MAG: hypothetical protein HQL22_12170 [Candidatus Omnitrophica bacterium]|nr:hypothetical protein [Candidatus Omnitrophota bacterium]